MSDGKRPVDFVLLKHMEYTCRELGKIVADIIDMGTSEHIGFALMLFTFHDGPEFTYISNAQRADMIKTLEEFAQRLREDTANELG